MCRWIRWQWTRTYLLCYGVCKVWEGPLQCVGNLTDNGEIIGFDSKQFGDVFPYFVIRTRFKLCSRRGDKLLYCCSGEGHFSRYHLGSTTSLLKQPDLIEVGLR
ncbi:hypothetical protein DPMN_080373 [Dreissena polymorpha]|uniref:Uncharacterized protein n=1 Tax=Dreissena polymorpha TaxID=45954 RepID=A0A9D3YUX5_DREPO|nr:hypothetical protein DPMN_080373 [Dreissena polymorpha]